MKQTKKTNKIRVLKTVRKTLQKILPFLCKEDAKFVVKTGMKTVMIGLQLITIYMINAVR